MKLWYKSRTLRFSALLSTSSIALLIAILSSGEVASYITSLPPEFQPIILAIIGVIIAALRLVTKEPITK